MAPRGQKIHAGLRTVFLGAGLLALWHMHGLSFLGARQPSVAPQASALRGATALAAAAGDVPSEGGLTALMGKAHLGDLEGVKELISGGADLNAQDDYGWTSLRYAVRAKHEEVAKALLEAGADPNLPSNSGRTPLMSAAGNGIISMIDILIDAGADKKLKDKNGLTAYNIALGAEEPAAQHAVRFWPTDEALP
eukprot:CAMPEP_0170591106 /NCGR_PEP_ID=MMETSP0224-20130122/12225_1 /TAXON_ID=285029 /ORGANISM="Togula jolla, Strain CCCM 725" /LENGTH=193 /DNA_ID=CAMNT_0010914945 /DNA_START=71 /DNA_END=650 /DNA_ORIENTATION=+